mmetsp:Transcript_23922/g.56641  ORF Transcript_23922/g.56641 Transcript_23922/m.56641 type:complete len:484 (-) Transcript_23922:1221-2672(-)
MGQNGWKQTTAGVMGNVLEWYDFALFGFFSDIIAEKFFPPSDTPTTSSSGGEFYDDNLLKSFAVYGVAFLMRPIGGLLVGNLGDKHGRKNALVMSLFLMAIPTFTLGCLPTYEQVGGLSTALLVICRLLQGMSVGGQLPASLIYTVEMRPKEHWGYYGALVMMAANVGTLLGNLVGALLRTVLTDQQLYSFGWRIPFWSGLLIAFVAAFLKATGVEHHPNEGQYDTGERDRSESESAEQQLQELPKHPIREALRRENISALVSATLVPMLWGAGFYISFVWMAIFMDDIIDPPIEGAFWINACALLFGVTIPLPLLGKLSDIIGRVKTMAIGAIGLGAFGPIMLLVISHGVPVQAIFAQWCLGIFLCFYGGPISAWLVEKFPPKIRLTSASLGYDVAHSTASAFSPLIATVLARNVGHAAPGILYTFFAILGLVGLLSATTIHQDGGVVEGGTKSDTKTDATQSGGGELHLEEDIDTIDKEIV